MAVTTSKQAGRLQGPATGRHRLPPIRSATRRRRGNRAASEPRDASAWNLLPPLTFVAMVGLWWAAVEFFKIPAYLLPGPGSVFSRLVTDTALLWTPLAGDADRDPAGLRA